MVGDREHIQSYVRVCMGGLGRRRTPIPAMSGSASRPPQPSQLSHPTDMVELIDVRHEKIRVLGGVKKPRRKCLLFTSLRGEESRPGCSAEILAASIYAATSPR